MPGGCRRLAGFQVSQVIEIELKYGASPSWVNPAYIIAVYREYDETKVLVEGCGALTAAASVEEVLALIPAPKA